MVKPLQLMSTVVPVLAVKFADQQVMLQLAQLKQHHSGEHMMSHASTMQTQLEAFLEKAVASQAPVNVNTNAANNGLSDSVYSAMNSALDTIEEQLGIEKNENQDQWDNANAAIVACGTTKDTAFTTGSGSTSSVNALKALVVTNRGLHKTCREQEDAERKDEMAKKTTRDTLASAAFNDPQKQNCLSSLPADPATLEDNLLKAKQWGESHQAGLLAAIGALTTSQGTADATAGECDDKQDTFETSFCSFRTAIGQACSTLTTCVEQKKTYRDDTLHDELTTKEAAEKIILKTCKKVRCYIELIEKSKGLAITSVAYNTCKDTEAATTDLNVDYSNLADGAVCQDESAMEPWEKAAYTKEVTTFRNVEYNGIYPGAAGLVPSGWIDTATGIKSSSECSV